MNYDNLPNNVYYDANIINNDQSGMKDPPKLVFQDIRSTPILSYPEFYELSVVRFNMQTANSLPLCIKLASSYDPNITTYSFYFRVFGLSSVIYDEKRFRLSPFLTLFITQVKFNSNEIDY